jgi:DNA-binding CsgD family transcriptional regulator
MALASGACAYADDLEEQLRMAVFEGSGPDSPAAAVLLVRVALADGDRPRAAKLALATESLAAGKPAASDFPAAADHVRGLLDRDAAALERAATAYSCPRARAAATEDAAQAAAASGDHGAAVAGWRRAYELYQQLECAPGMARVRAGLRNSGVRLHHWRRGDRPAFGWDSLTDTERRIADLVAQGLSNREVAAEVFLSAHTVAFHLRHIFWKLDVSSRVQLARLAARNDQAAVRT